MREDWTVIWDLEDDPDGNLAHIAEHDLTPDEVDTVLLDAELPIEFSRSTGEFLKEGVTSTGRYICVVWTVVNDDPRMVYPITAFEPDDPLE